MSGQILSGIVCLGYLLSFSPQIAMKGIQDIGFSMFGNVNFIMIAWILNMPLKVIQAPEELDLQHPSVFLAGGISHCPPWHEEMIGFLQDHCRH